ncbi:hypothetical protein HDU76_012561 [Blyttiomyces sp. JEL0837]|nr:hypothetical protein HDU76_012561 [Blyttiomyces sp. JEL0837]
MIVLPKADTGILDLPTFDQYVMSVQDGNATYVSNFQMEFGCPSFNGHMQRFHMSLVCNYFVSYSQPACLAQQQAANATAVYQPLCQSSCLTYFDSVNNIFNNPAMCPQTTDPTILQNRASFVSPQSTAAYHMFCNTLTSNDTNVCSPGLSTDVAQLGFFFAADPLAFCLKGNPMGADADACAIQINAFQLAVVKLLNPISSFPWIVSGIAFGVMCVIFLFFALLTCGKSWKRAATMASQPAPAPDRKPLNEPGYTGTILRGKTLNRSLGSRAQQPQRNSIFQQMRNSVFGGRNGAGMGGGMMQMQSRRESDIYSQVARDPVNPQGNLLVKMVAIDNYSAQLTDELSLIRGDIVIIEEMFDDGWATARLEATGEVGAVPLACLGPMNGRGKKEGGGGGRRSVVSQRTASLYLGQP